MIKKTDTLGTIMAEYPEVAPVLASAGLHCIGCHVSTYETLEEGCLSHGMSKKDVDALVKSANARIAEYDKLPKVVFSDKVFAELNKRLGKPKKKFVRIVQNFGEFDFEASNIINDADVVIELDKGKEKVSVVVPKNIERMLRGVRIDFDPKVKDFTAARV
jgi:hybrid cluster-associated redox disulfide protein